MHPHASTTADRLTALSQACLRINENLDLETVLQEVLDSARALTGAWYGVILLQDEAGAVQDYLTSGLTAVQVGQLRGRPESLRLRDFLRTQTEPCRLRDLRAHLRALRLPDYPLPQPGRGPLAFLAAPVRHRGETIGHVYLAGKEGHPVFSAEDEETLVMFAAQAALVISHAQRHREEQRARADLETLVHTAPVGVAVIEAQQGRVRSLNREARRLVGNLLAPGQEAAQLRDVVRVRRADGRPVSLGSFPLTRAFPPVRAEEIVITTPDGRMVTALVNATPLPAAGEGPVESLVVTLQDLTPLTELERLRAEFLALVSHELRTPLTAIKGAITTLQEPSTPLNPAEIQQFHHIIDGQTDRMRELIADLLDVAHIETGRLRIAPEPTEVAVLVEEARTAFHSSGARHRLDLDLAPDLPLVRGDRLRLVQVLHNLLANAARHTAESAAITVTAAPVNTHVAVSVADEGSGVAPEQLPHLFRKFAGVGSGDWERDPARTGLGLAICQGIVEAHGGRIWAESAGPGQGTCFTFTVPTVDQAAEEDPLVPGPRPRPAVPEEAVPGRILAVDDDPLALRYIRDILVQAGYEAIVTTVPEEVLPLLARESPALVLLDLRLPGTDGLALLAAIRAQADVPVIFLSVYGQDQFIAQALDGGAADYVVKPFSPTEMVARIRAALRQWAAAQPQTPFVLGELTIDYAAHRVLLAGHPVRLTAIQYRILVELAAQAGRVVTYGQLLRRVWHLEDGYDLRPMRTAISSIRRQLGDDADHPTYIFTEPSVGYRLARPAPPLPTGTPRGTQDP